jgi:tetratricopeptide (TPR) repeat protein
MSSTEIAKQAGAICVGAVALAMGVAAGATIGAIAGVNLAIIWRDLKSSCVSTTHRKAVAAVTDGLARNREFSTDDLATVAALLSDLPKTQRFDPNVTVQLLAEDQFVTQTADMLIDLINPDPQTPALTDILRLAFQAGLSACMKSPEFRSDMKWDIDLSTLQAVYRVESQVLDLVATIEATLGGQIALTEQVLIQMAKRIALDVPDRDTALRELDRAVTVAQRLQIEGSRPSNHVDFVDDVFARVAELNRQDALDEGADAFQAALNREAEESNARRSKILDGLVDQNILRRNADGVANALIQKLQLDHPDPTAHFNALRAIQIEWYERGRDKGLNFDLSVSIALARHCLALGQDADQRGAALNNLGNALKTLGEREAGTDRLEQAVAAYTEALKERTRDRVPLQWAATQNNLGNALGDLGEREAGTDRLEQAIAAFTDALKERTRDRVPIDWAATMFNIGLTHLALADKDNCPDPRAALRDALNAVDAALGVYDAKASPFYFEKAARLRDHLLQRLKDLPDL